MNVKAAPEPALSLARHWSRNARTGRLEAHWRLEASVKREETLSHFTRKT